MIETAVGTKFGATEADTFWLLICGFLVFFMQCGFALLEAGTVRAKNTKNILLKNLLDACVGALIWWSVGFMIAVRASAYSLPRMPDAHPARSPPVTITLQHFWGVRRLTLRDASCLRWRSQYDSGHGFIGASATSGAAPSFFLQGPLGVGEDSTGYSLAGWFFQYVFAAAAATIVSGAMAERTALSGYICYTVIITAFIYPVVVHWGWSGDGWISAFNSGALLGGVQDFAGSGIVHMTGGVAALVGAAIVGPRTGRFDEKKQPLPMPGHSTTLQVMGTFILWLGWYGFNPGSTLGLSAPNYARDAARVVVTTTIAAATGGVTVIILEKLLGDKTWNVGAVCNGILAGLVSITAGCSVTYPWSAALIALIGGFVYFGSSKCVLKICKVDDPLDAFAVHGACGFWGVFAVGLLAAPPYAYVTFEGASNVGLFYGSGNALGAACICLAAEIAWVGGMSFLMFFPLKKLGMLRVSAEIEAAGMDVSKHGGSAYEGGAA